MDQKLRMSLGIGVGGVVLRAAARRKLRTDEGILMSAGMKYPLYTLRGNRTEAKRVSSLLSCRATYEEKPGGMGRSLECRWEIFGRPSPTVRYYGADTGWLTGNGEEPLPGIDLVTLLQDFHTHACA